MMTIYIVFQVFVGKIVFETAFTTRKKAEEYIKAQGQTPWHQAKPWYYGIEKREIE